MKKSLSYKKRIDQLRLTKQLQTLEKQRVDGTNGYWDIDDKGIVPKPDWFNYVPESNHKNGDFYGFLLSGKNYRNLLETHPVYINKASALAGGWMHQFMDVRVVKWNPDIKYEHLHELQKKYDLIHGIGGAQHFNVDYELGLRLGFTGILKKILIYEKQDNKKHSDFYTAEKDVVIGMFNMITRHVNQAREMAKKEDDLVIKQNLIEMANVNEALLKRPAESFHEAVQFTAWYVIFATMYNNSGAGGAIDGYLYPYYESEKKNKTIDDERAIYLLACLLMKDNQYYEIGGTYADGTDRCNDLSFFMVEAAHRLKIPTSICVRVHENMNRDLLTLSVKYLFKDKLGTPSFVGHKGMTEGFMKNGYSVELARVRAKTGCHWCSLPGLEYTLNDIVKINFLAIFDVAYKEVINNNPTVEKIWHSFEKHLKIAVRTIAKGMDFQLDNMYKVLPELVLNLLCHGPIESGLDISNGGAKYYNLCIDGAALATVADSFSAMKQRIEIDEKLTWDELNEVLSNNYENSEVTRLLLKSVPKYGTGNSIADEYASKITKLFTKLVKEKPTPAGYPMIPGLFSWANTIGFGKTIGATPNGRKASEPISHGANPAAGFVKDGTPTAMANAVINNQCGYGNASPLQLEFDPRMADDDKGIELVSSFIETFCEMGGTLLNINILNKEQILEAHDDPSKHPNLIVRVTGFSAYFASLSKEFRQLVVDRIVEGL
ncbi:MAG: formate acetyltransferase [Clostridiales bacterium]|nr:formate acetyltransferase [Clostridiales bacterium]